MQPILTTRELLSLCADPVAVEACSVASGAGNHCVIVDLGSGTPDGASNLIQPACTVIGLARSPDAAIPPMVDVIARSDAELAMLYQATERNPVAACLLAQVLRHNANASVADGLLVESLAYSTLQHGAAFTDWLARRAAAPPRTHVEAVDPIQLGRQGDRLRLTLNRPTKRNAFSAGLRDALCSALEIAWHDDSVQQIVIDGAGPAFCAGGDLDEFGWARDAALAHATRMTRSAGAMLHRLRERITCQVHGACIGAGIELPAFTARVRALPDAFFQLPEVSMGLIPGAGGTVSITRRIGRLRTAALALSGQRIDAATALDWGLVDEVVDRFE